MVLEIEKILELNSMFDDVILVNQICECMMINKDMKKRMGIPDGTKDVIIKSKIDKKKLISRVELQKNFRDVHGKSLKIHRMKYNKKYVVVSKLNEIPMKSFYVQGNKIKIIYKENKIKNGSYIVCGLNENGNIDKSNIRILPKSIFEKMFKLVQRANLNNIKQEVMQLHQLKKIDIQNTKAINEKPWRPEPKKDEVIQNNKIQTQVIKRIMKNGKIVGFIILENGNQVRINLLKARELCRNNMIKNITIVKHESTGKEFFRGVGIKLENIPVEYIN